MRTYILMPSYGLDRISFFHSLDDNQTPLTAEVKSPIKEAPTPRKHRKTI